MCMKSRRRYKILYIAARVNLHFPLLCIWPIDGNSIAQSWHSSAMNRPGAKFKKYLFSNCCRCAKCGLQIENRIRYLKQYLFCFCKQQIYLFLSITLNWSIEVNITVCLTPYRILGSLTSCVTNESKEGKTRQF
jgi:hypothetical protein